MWRCGIWLPGLSNCLSQSMRFFSKAFLPLLRQLGCQSIPIHPLVPQGSWGRTRTFSLLLNRQSLKPLSYPGLFYPSSKIGGPVLPRLAMLNRYSLWHSGITVTASVFTAREFGWAMNSNPPSACHSQNVRVSYRHAAANPIGEYPADSWASG